MIRNGTWTCCVRRPQIFYCLLGMMQNIFEPCSEGAEDTTLQPRRSVDRYRRHRFLWKKSPRTSPALESGIPKRTLRKFRSEMSSTSQCHLSLGCAPIHLDSPGVNARQELFLENRGS